ncbi:hypothetical protein QFC19_001680 [Naganishia cerealis]|uniref:Uncharacterized protein n=1 Tax=Naganishia cerealis TaxID=610337 RepID=A0ACC2WGU9_9TREE|nr:hypothetical protein QFC19_001680 [Naganishia cerealis]
MSSGTPSLLDTKIWDEHPAYNPPPSASIREPLGPDLQPYAATTGSASFTSRYPTVCHHKHHDHSSGTDDERTYTRGMEGQEDDSPPMASTSRLTLADFRRSEGPTLRAQKLHALWKSLPTLPEPSDRPTATQMVKLPGQDTIGILSPERAERLRRLYLEELSRRVSLQDRPEARLWGGADDLSEPEIQQQQQQQHQQHHPHHHQKKSGKGIAWKDFRKFLWDQEKELWDIFHDLDRDGDGKLDVAEMRNALQRSGIEMTDSGLRDFVSFLASGSSTNIGTQQERKDATYITFAEFRDFLLLLPRKASVAEIYKFYQVRKRFADGRGAARVNMDGDLSVSFPKTTAPPSSSPGTASTPTQKTSETLAVCQAHEAALVDGHEYCGSSEAQLADGARLEHVEEEEEDTDDNMEFNRHVAWKFLLAGGVAGAVSRTATAPFDRLKVYLITKTDTPQELKRPPDVLHSGSATEAVKQTTKLGRKGFGHLGEAVVRIYRDGGGVRAFWVGNGLNVTKIFPESAIKFFSYEYSKRLFARYWDCVPEQSDISGTSRFISGGIGGITSQITIYPVETLKTQLQSRIGRKVAGESAVANTARAMWKSGGIRAYYRGLTLGLIGVFPYSAIDMSTFEALKIAYCKSFDLDEPQVLAVLSFGALSGSIGATSVYPINLLRTRLQASGSPGHPTVYTGFLDVAQQTLAREGWAGLYKGLVPTLAKVVPAVSISYVVYEHCKRTLHIG